MTDTAAIDGVVTSAVKWGGTTVAVAAAVTLTEWLGIIGLCVAIIGTFINSYVNLHYKRKADKRAEDVHQVQMKPHGL